MKDNLVYRAVKPAIDGMLEIACKPSVGSIAKYIKVGRRTYRVRLKVEEVRQRID